MLTERRSFNIVGDVNAHQDSYFPIDFIVETKIYHRLVRETVCREFLKFSYALMIITHKRNSRANEKSKYYSRHLLHLIILIEIHLPISIFFLLIDTLLVKESLHMSPQYVANKC